MGESSIPSVVMIDPENPGQGQNVTVTVVLNKQVQQDQAVSISGTPSGYFSSLPSQVTVPSGNDRVSFGATIDTSASGSGSITSTCNGAQAVGICSVTPS